MSPTPSRDEIFRRISVVLQGCGVRAASIRDDASFRGTFTMDSVDVVDFIAAIDREFRIDVGFEHYHSIHTVNDLVRFVEAKLAAKSAEDGP